MVEQCNRTTVNTTPYLGSRRHRVTRYCWVTDLSHTRLTLSQAHITYFGFFYCRRFPEFLKVRHCHRKLTQHYLQKNSMFHCPILQITIHFSNRPNWYINNTMHLLFSSAWVVTTLIQWMRSLFGCNLFRENGRNTRTKLYIFGFVTSYLPQSVLPG